MKLKDFKKLNENWNKWKEPVKEESIEEAPRYFQSGGKEEQPHLAEMQAMKEKLGTLANDLIDKLGGSSEIQDAQSYLDDAARAINGAMESIRYSLETQGLSEGDWYSDEHETLADKKFADSQAVGQESVDFQVGDYVRVVSGGLKGATGKVIELTTLVTDEPGLVVLLDSDAHKRVFGQAGDEVVVGMNHVQPPVGQMRERISPEQEEANEKAYSRCFEMGRKGVDVKTALRSGPVADFEACRAGHQDGANEFRQSLAERVRQTVVSKLQEKAKSKNQQQFMGMVKKCQDTGDCASDEVKKAADSMKKSDVKDFASTKHKGLPNKVEDKK